MPSVSEVRALRHSFPDALLFRFPKLPGPIERDFKWLGSYRDGIMHLGGEEPDDLRGRCERASSLIGWPAPYADNMASIQGLRDPSTDWPSEAAADSAAG